MTRRRLQCSPIIICLVTEQTRILGRVFFVNDAKQLQLSKTTYTDINTLQKQGV